MNILVTLDRNYLPPLRVMLGSLLRNDPGETFEIYAIGDGLLGNGGALLPSYTNGFYTCRGADVFVTRGLGGMVRILNRPEVAVVILRRN